MFPKGTFRARARTWDLGQAETGNEQIGVEFEAVDGEPKGQRITWYGYFTEGTFERTFESLRHMGWQGNDLSALEGLDRNEVDIVVDHEVYQDKPRAKVRWVNKPGGLAMKTRLDDGKKAAFAEKMKGKIALYNQKAGPPAAPAGNGSSTTKPPF